MSIQIPDDLLVAYIDGELDDAARAQIERALSSDSRLAQRVARERWMRARQGSGQQLGSTQRVVPLTPRAPGRTAVPTPAQVIDLARVRAQRSRRQDRNGVLLPRRAIAALGGALAAGALIGFLLTRFMGGTHPAEFRSGFLQASGELARALSDQLSARSTAGAQVRVGASFRAREGGFCRTFQLELKSSMSGLACREQDHWRIVALLSPETAQAPSALSRLPAASPSVLQEAISERTSGSALDADAEHRALEAGWR